MNNVHAINKLQRKGCLSNDEAPKYGLPSDNDLELALAWQPDLDEEEQGRVEKKKKMVDYMLTMEWLWSGMHFP
jgi:hypothetical protein